MSETASVIDQSGPGKSPEATPGTSSGPFVSFTGFVSPRRLAKHYKHKPGGGLETISGTRFSSGGYYVYEIPASGKTGPAILNLVGHVIDKLTSKQAIGLGVPKDGSKSGTIVTKAQHAKGNTSAIPRSKDYFGWPGIGLLLLDGDDIDGLWEILIELYPPFKDVALLVRPGASASIIDPLTGKRLKASEHGYAIIDEPELSDACLKALMRLAWVKGKDNAAGRLMLSKRGDVLVRGPIDTSVGSPERLSYEGEAVIDDGIARLPRVSKVVGGNGMLCAKDLIAFADLHATEAAYEARIAEAKAEAEFCQRRDAARVAYRGEHIAKAVKRGIPRKRAEKAYDESIAAGGATIEMRTWLPLTDEHVLYTPDGKEFTIADIKKARKKYHDTECSDPIEGQDYQSKNCAVIYTDGDEIRIYSRAHGDAYAYVAPFEEEPWDWVFARVTGVQEFEEVTTAAFSEDAIALEFSGRHADEVRYTAQWGQWHIWDGQRWAKDRKRKVFSMVRTIVRETALGVKNVTARMKIASNKTKMGALGFAMDEQRTAAVSEQWDADIWQLCTPGGMVNLQTGKLRTARPDDYCTMMTAVKPGGDCPLWLEFLETVTAGDKELIKFLQVCCGYALTGSTREQILLFLWGRGGNGKSVFIETINTARFVRQEPQFTLMIYGNFKPGLKSVDEAIRRRLKLIPFTVTIPKGKRDKDLITKLQAEWGGVLAWMIEGCVIWQREGLVTPRCVEDATNEYLHEEDMIGRWIDETCVRDPQALTQHGVLFESWKVWSESARAFIGSSKQFSAELKARGFDSKETNQGTAFIGLRVGNPMADVHDTIFLNLLQAETTPVSPDADDENYAPVVFAAKQQAVSGPALAAAMQRLLRIGKIKAQGKPAALAVAQPN